MERCFGSNSKTYSDYHDFEWGIPLHDDRDLFELLILEGAHAGLSWEIILNKRDNYRRAFYNFDVNLVASMTDGQLDNLLLDKGIVRNKLKVYSARKNAKVFIEIQKEFGSFDKYIWEFFNFQTIKNAWKDFESVPVSSEESDKISKDLKKRGMSFVGSKIIYAYMQSAGMVNDHIVSCPEWKKVHEF